MENNKTRINWIALSVGFAVALLLAVPLLPKTKWIAQISINQLQGEEDIWNLSPDRIKGDSEDEQLARILLSHNDKRADLLREFITHHPNRIDARAHYLRYRFNEIISTDATLSSETANEFSLIAREGLIQDPDNFYWPILEAAFWTEADEQELVRDAVLNCDGLSNYDDYAMDESEIVITELNKDNPGLTDAEEIIVFANVIFPHMAGIRVAAKALPEEAIDERIIVAKLALAMSKDADTVIGFLVASNIAKLVIMPGETRRFSTIDRGELEVAAEGLAALRPDEADTFKRTAALAATTSIASAEDYYDFDWDTPMQAQHAKWYAGVAFWILGSALTILLSRYLVKLANHKWIPRVAPFVGFLLLGWVAIALQKSAHDISNLWDWHVPEIAIGGFLIGFLALSEKYATATRWAAVILSILVIPALAVTFYIAVPIVTIWVSMFLTSKHGQKIKAHFLRAILPCALASPLAFMIGAGPGASVGMLLLIVTALALPLASNMQLPDNKRHLLSLSIFIPCIVLIGVIQLNLSTDATLKRGLELEQEQLAKYQQSAQT